MLLDMTHPKKINPARNFAGAGIPQGNLYLHGGDVLSGSDCCGAPFGQNMSRYPWKFNRQSGIWNEISSEVGAAPRIKRQRGVEVDNRLYLFTGYDFVDGVGQVWNLDVDSFKARSLAATALLCDQWHRVRWCN